MCNWDTDAKIIQVERLYDTMITNPPVPVSCMIFMSLVGPLSMIVKLQTSRRFVPSSDWAHWPVVTTWHLPNRHPPASSVSQLAPFQFMGPLLYFNRRHIIDEKHANIANKILKLKRISKDDPNSTSTETMTCGECSRYYRYGGWSHALCGNQ